MHIQTESTPNPSSLKFLPGKSVMEKETADFRNVEKAKRSPFALNLFKIDGVEGVFFGSDFISITKADNHDWQMLKSSISETIIEYYKSGVAIILQEKENNIDTSNTRDSEAVVKIKEIIDNKSYLFNSGLGLKISDDVKNKYPFVNNSGYKLKR